MKTFKQVLNESSTLYQDCVKKAIRSSLKNRDMSYAIMQNEKDEYYINDFSVFKNSDQFIEIYKNGKAQKAHID